MKYMLPAGLALVTRSIHWTILMCKGPHGSPSLVFNFCSPGQVEGLHLPLATVQKNPGESEHFIKTKLKEKKLSC